LSGGIPVAVAWLPENRSPDELTGEEKVCEKT
jgi:hypothetical protein